MAYDFPDFLSSKQASNTLVRIFDQTVTANTTIPAIDLTQFSEVIISVNNEDAAAIMELQIGFLGGILDPTPNPVKSVVFGALQSGMLRVPALREVLQIIAVPHGAVATQHLQVTEYGMLQHVNIYDLYTGPPSLFTFSGALAANGNTTQFISQWYAGPVEIAALGDAAGPCLIVIDYYDGSAGTYKELLQFGMPGQNVNGITRMTFPPNPIRVRIFNGATAQTVEVYIAASALNGI